MPSAVRQIPFAFNGLSAFALDDFAGAANRDMVESIRGLADGRRNGLIYLYGEGGSGKTHLLCAAANVSHARSLKVCCIDLACHTELVPAILQGMEQLALVCLDNIDAVLPDAGWERAIMALFDGLRDRGGLLISANGKPARLPFSLPDLQTRLCWDLIYGIRPLADHEKVQALQRRAQALTFDLSDELAWYMVNQVSREPRRLFHLLELLDATSLARQRRPTIPLIKELATALDGEGSGHSDKGGTTGLE